MSKGIAMLLILLMSTSLSSHNFVERLYALYWVMKMLHAPIETPVQALKDNVLQILTPFL